MRSRAPSSSRLSTGGAPREQTRAAMRILRSTTTRLRLAPPPSPACSASTSAPGPSGRSHRRGKALDSINNATKWTVSATAALVLLKNSGDASTCFTVIGSVVAAFFTKILKKNINEARPSEARRRDPGMPSSHAQSLAFLSVSAARAILASSTKKREETAAAAAAAVFLPPAPALAALVLAAAMLLATLRVVLGYHTLPQVVAGGALGCLLALAWAELGARVVVPLCSGKSGSGVASTSLACATGLAVAVFAFVTVRGWWREENEKVRMTRS